MTISILTCVLGDPDALHATSASLKPWLGPSLSWTIKFSETSTDAFVRSFAGSHVEVVRRADRSVYDAMNQGLELLRADRYFVIGAGDTVTEPGMRRMTDLLAGDALDHSAFLAPILLEASNRVFAPQPDTLRVRMSCPHPGAILEVAKSRAIGGFDTTYRVAADYDHLSRYVLRFGPPRVLDMPPLVSFAAGGISERQSLEGYLEEELIRKRVWKAPDLAVHGRMLERSAGFIGATIRRSVR